VNQHQQVRRTKSGKFATPKHQNHISDLTFRDFSYLHISSLPNLGKEALKANLLASELG